MWLPPGSACPAAPTDAAGLALTLSLVVTLVVAVLLLAAILLVCLQLARAHVRRRQQSGQTRLQSWTGNEKETRPSRGNEKGFSCQVSDTPGAAPDKEDPVYAVIEKHRATAAAANSSCHYGCVGGGAGAVSSGAASSVSGAASRMSCGFVWTDVGVSAPSEAETEMRQSVYAYVAETPLSCQTSIVPIARNQFYLVVQINLNAQNDASAVLEE